MGTSLTLLLACILVDALSSVTYITVRVCTLGGFSLMFYIWQASRVTLGMCDPSDTHPLTQPHHTMPKRIVWCREGGKEQKKEKKNQIEVAWSR